MAFHQAQIGKTLPVLFDKPSKSGDQMSGRSPYLQPVHVPLGDVDAAALRGRILPVEISAAHANSLSGVLAI
jgi:tRNA-2-methylthio-N6-dimethylallyladenosine synthase